jgi:hypothetical protein
MTGPTELLAKESSALYKRTPARLGAVLGAQRNAINPEEFERFRETLGHARSSDPRRAS